MTEKTKRLLNEAEENLAKKIALFLEGQGFDIEIQDDLDVLQKALVALNVMEGLKEK